MGCIRPGVLGKNIFSCLNLIVQNIFSDINFFHMEIVQLTIQLFTVVNISDTFLKKSIFVRCDSERNSCTKKLDGSTMIVVNNSIDYICQALCVISIFILTTLKKLISYTEYIYIAYILHFFFQIIIYVFNNKYVYFFT